VINAGNAVSKLVHAVSTSFGLKLASSTGLPALVHINQA